MLEFFFFLVSNKGRSLMQVGPELVHLLRVFNTMLQWHLHPRRLEGS